MANFSSDCNIGKFTGSLGCSKLKTHLFGDPHFIGFDGTRFDLHGDPDKYYNLISDDYVQVNALFLAWNGTIDTNMGEIGVRLGTKKTGFTNIFMNRDGTAAINDQELNHRVYFPLFDDAQGYAQFSTNFEGFDPTLPDIQHAGSFEGAKVYVNAGKYAFTIVRCSEPVSDTSFNKYFLNLITDIRNPNIRPHGIIGQTFDTSKERKPCGKQGEGVIEGVYPDYEVSSLWASDFKYNRFARVVKI